MSCALANKVLVIRDEKVEIYKGNFDDFQSIWRQRTIRKRRVDRGRPWCAYECTRCPRKWTGKPGSQQCGCGSLYVRWVNYEEWRDADGHSAAYIVITRGRGLHKVRT